MEAWLNVIKEVEHFLPNLDMAMASGMNVSAQQSSYTFFLSFSFTPPLNVPPSFCYFT
jgi:hypothetical protein